MPLSYEISVEGGISPRSGPTVSSGVKDIPTGRPRKNEETKCLTKKSSMLIWLNDCLPKELGVRTFDPQEPFLQRWNIISLVFCVIAVTLDPLFFYIPVLDAKHKCLGLDRKLMTTACVLRSIADVVYVLHIIIQFNTGSVARPSRDSEKCDVIPDPLANARRFLPSSTFIIDLLSVLPIPQVALLCIIPLKLSRPVSLMTKEWLKYIIFFQYVPRLVRIRPLWKKITGSVDLFTEIVWARAAFNLFLYMLASHLVGASWYFFSIEQENRCWKGACKKPTCHHNYLYCGEYRPDTSYLKILNASCAHIERSDIHDSSVFDFGLFLDALQPHVAESKEFTLKFFYCFWWGLRNLSSLGQNLKTSASIGEIIFAVFISVFGLLLFSSLIGNMQRYLQSNTIRIDEMMREKRQATMHLISHLSLPENLRERIKRYEQYKWQESKGVEQETLISNLPKDLRRDIKRHLCLDILMRVPMFEIFDEQLLAAMCDNLKSVFYTEGSFVVHEGEAVDEMLFVMQGKLLSTTINGERTGFFNSCYLKAGDFFGEELLPWALDPCSSGLPISTRTVGTLTKVEAFALKADDMKRVASQFRRLHSKELQNTFRFYSSQWRTWAACFIQAAWRLHCKRKLMKSQSKRAASISLGAAIYASKFAVSARHLRLGDDNLRLSESLLAGKPAEPDFAA